MQTKRLYRSRSTRVLGGVAGGLAEYFDIDPIIMRLIFIGLVFIGGGGIIIYIIMWIVIPENHDYQYFSQNANPMEENHEAPPNPGWDAETPNKPAQHNKGGLIAGLILITLGFLFLVERFIPRIDFGDLWPVLLIVAGIALLSNAYIKPKNP